MVSPGSFGRRLVALVAQAALLLAVAVPAAAAAGPEDVGRADAVLDEARRRQTSVEIQLDSAAELYEHAHAHRLRLAEEEPLLDDEVVRAGDSVSNAREDLGRRVARAYMHPGFSSPVTEVILSAPDTPTALHQAALLSRIAERGADRVFQAERVAEFATGDARQLQVVSVGAKQALDDLQRRSDDLNAELEVAERSVATAEVRLADARREAAREAAAEEAARRRRAAALAAPTTVVTTAATANTNQAPPRLVDGKVCPVGQPNGFIDSWGFPRSGGRSHQGVDMFAPYGTPLYAVADGSILRVYTNTLGGLAINVLDEDGNMYYYAHLSSATVTTGQEVRAGQVIGAVGDSGNARGTPPHLHWQFHPGNGAPVNPYPLATALCR